MTSGSATRVAAKHPMKFAAEVVTVGVRFLASSQALSVVSICIASTTRLGSHGQHDDHDDCGGS